MNQGPYILDADNKPKLVTRREYGAWVRSLQASEEWRWGGKAFETLFLRSDWLPHGAGSINTVFDPYAPSDANGPLVFKTDVSCGDVLDGRFVDLASTTTIECARYHTREQALHNHSQILHRICTNSIGPAGLSSWIPLPAPPAG